MKMKKLSISNKVKTFFKTRWAWIVSLVFMWVIPIILLNERFALLETAPAKKATTVLTFSGLCVVVAIFIACYKKITRYIHNLKHGIVRAVWVLLSKGIIYALVLCACIYIDKLANQIFEWWKLVGICWLLGIVFVWIDETRKDVEEDGKG